MKLFIKVINGSPAQVGGKWGCTPIEMCAQFQGIGLTSNQDVWESADFDVSYLGIYPLTLTQPPATNPETEIVTEVSPVLVNGVWTQAWVVSNLSADVVASKHASEIDTAKASKLIEIGMAYNGEINANIAYMGTSFQADEYSRDLMSQVISACGGILPVGFTWYDINNTPIEMTFSQLQGLAGAILMRGQPLFVKSQTLKSVVRLAQSVASINAVVW